LVLRLGIDGHTLDGKRQGSQSVLIQFLSTLSAVGRDDIIVTVYCDKPHVHAADPRFSSVHFAPLRAKGRTRRLIFGGLGAEGDNDVEFYSYAAPLMRSVPVVLLVHDVLPFTHPSLFKAKFRFPWRILVSHSVRRAGRILTVSETGRRALGQLFPKVSERTASALNGPSFTEEILLQARLPAGPRPYVLCVGRIEKRKNVGLLINAFLAADLAHVDLVIVGRHDEGFVLSIPSDPRIRHEAGVDDNRLKELYRGAALFVYPSEAEGFGIPLLDALAFGLPTIASDRTSMPEVGGALPCYFNPQAPDALDRLASLISKHFSDEPIPAPSGEDRRKLLDRFNWRRFTETVLNAAADAAQVQR
jgi:glycosyltransferase involved in cell wall biosynthesis